MIFRRIILVAGAAMAAGGLWLTASALLIPLKAAVAQFLLQRAGIRHWQAGTGKAVAVG